MKTINFYGSIHGLKSIAMIGVVMMHVNLNSNYRIDGFIYNSVIPSFVDFVFLFMVISAFGINCGYYDKIKESKISLSSFYLRRFSKVLPFFALLVFLDFVISPSLKSAAEAYVNITLMFGFLPHPDNISVIGVGWYLGLVFAFYALYPFYCVLIETKTKAISVFLASVLFSCVSYSFFDANRSNIVFSACFFFLGGIIYLYKDKLEKTPGRVALSVLIISIVLYYYFGANLFSQIIVQTTMLIFALSDWGGVLDNKLFAFLSSISYEIYLSHMLIFRIIEKMRLNIILGNGIIQYIFTVILVFIGAIIFSVTINILFKLIKDRISNYFLLKKPN